MTYTRTVTASPPAPAPGRSWLATALLEAPDIDGQPGEFTALEATPGASGRIETRHAQYLEGWYRVQWYDDGQTSAFSDPVRLTGTVASNTGRTRR